jgi:GxxExxY protein
MRSVFACELAACTNATLSGMLESACETGLAMEFAALRLDFERQRPLPFVYRGVTVDKGYRLDFLVEQKVVVEVEAVERIERVHKAQVLSYLKQTRCKVGLLFNFNVRILMLDGFRRIAMAFLTNRAPRSLRAPRSHVAAKLPDEPTDGVDRVPS